MQVHHPNDNEERDRLHGHEKMSVDRNHHTVSESERGNHRPAQAKVGNDINEINVKEILFCNIKTMQRLQCYSNKIIIMVIQLHKLNHKLVSFIFW